MTTIAVDQFMRNNARLHAAELRELQDQHNVNRLGDDDQWFDADPAGGADLEEIDDLEFVERYID